MSISFPSADFVPTLSGYTGQGPFRFWCQKVLPIVYDDSLSYYELLNKVVIYLNNVIKDMSSVVDNQTELERVFNNLLDYVKNYFTNLDVQNEINNKLDSMAEDGTLSDIIAPILARYLNSVYTQPYDFTRFRYLNTTCHILTIPKTLDDGTKARFRLGFANNEVGRKNDGWVEGGTLPSGHTETVESFAIRENRPVATNGGYFNMASSANIRDGISGDGWWPDGITIKDGEYICAEPYKYYYQEYTTTAGEIKRRENDQTLAIMDDGSFTYYDNSYLVERAESYAETHPQLDGESDGDYCTRCYRDVALEMIADGVVQTLTAHFAVIVNGETGIDAENGRKGTAVYFIKIIGYDDDNYYLFSSAGEWGDEETGISLSDAAALLLSFGWKEAYACDSGGSSSINYLTNKINLNKDTLGLADRPVGTMLYLDTISENSIPMSLGRLIGNLKHEVSRLESYARSATAAVGQYLTIDADSPSSGYIWDINSLDFCTVGVWQIINNTIATRVAHLPFVSGGRLETKYITGPRFIQQTYIVRESIFATEFSFSRRGSRVGDATEFTFSDWVLDTKSTNEMVYVSNPISGVDQVSNIIGGFTIVGNICFVSVKFTLARDISENEISGNIPGRMIISPIDTSGYNPATPYNFASFRPSLGAYNFRKKEGCRVYVDNLGKLRFWGVANETVGSTLVCGKAGDVIEVNGCYRCRAHAFESGGVS